MELIAQKREELGRKTKKIRREKKLPVVVFGKGMDSTPLTVDYTQFEKVYRASGASTLVDLKVEGDAMVKVLVSEVSYHPVTDKILHANLHKVNLKEKIQAAIPIKVVGEPDIVKSGEGLVLTLLGEITVEALPTDLPHSIEVDISHLKEIGDAVTVGELKVDKSKVEIVGQEEDELVVKIDHAVMQEEETPALTEEELVAQVEASAQLSDEEKAEKEGEKKDKEDEE